MTFIKGDDLSDGQIVRLLDQHRREMFKHSPPESVHALDAAQLADPDLRFFSAWQDNEFAGCGALKHHSKTLAEIKSMKTDDKFLRQGVARAMLSHLIEQARLQAYQMVALETGTMDAFVAARTLYLRHGFEVCAPFANYFEDPNSVCMSLRLV